MPDFGMLGLIEWLDERPCRFERFGRTERRRWWRVAEPTIAPWVVRLHSGRFGTGG